MITAEVLLSHLGKSTEDAELQELLKSLGVSPKGPRLNGGFGDQRIPSEGIHLFFKAASYHRNVPSVQTLPANAKVFSDVLFSHKGFDGGPPFGGDLPFGLKFAESRVQARERLGPPSWVSPLVENDRWEEGGRFLTIDFAADESYIKKVTVGLVWKL